MLNLSTADLVRALSACPRPFLIVAAGNVFRRDDGVGPYIAAALKQKGFIAVVDAGDTPESVIDEVVALTPAGIVFVDAADFQGRAGDVRFVDEKTVHQALISTHRIPLPLVAGMIADQIRTEVFYLGIQAASLDFGEGLSVEVREAADRVVEAVLKQSHSGESRVKS